MKNTTNDKKFTNQQANETRRAVSKTYADAVTKPVKMGCCGSTPASKWKGAVAALGGYSDAELAALPEEAVGNSFGCGNPVALAGLQAGDVVLDLGSGAGIDLFLAAKKVGPQGRVIGVDMTDEMIAKANENMRSGKFANVEVRKGIIEDLPVESGSIDWVISNCVINLSPEKPKVFSEIARVLKRGGQMLVSDMVARDLPADLRNLPIVYTSCIAGAISEEEYLSGLREAGLVDVEVCDRLVYDASQLYSIATAALEEHPSVLAQLGSCAGASNLKPRLRAFAGALEGKIWSAKIYGRKPAPANGKRSIQV